MHICSKKHNIHSTPPKNSHLVGNSLHFSGRERQDILPEYRLGALYSSAGAGDIELLKDVLQYVKKGEFKINGWADAGGWGHVHRAAGMGHLEWIKLAHEEGGLDLWVKSNNGTLPIDQARKHGFSEMINYFEAEYAKGNANPSENKRWDWRVACKKTLQFCYSAMETVLDWLLVPFRWLLKQMNFTHKSQPS
jgi:hypothetical protein